MKIKIKDQEVNIPEGATFEVVDGDLVVTPKKQKFKDGDILVLKNERTCVFIYNGNGNYTTSFYVARWDGKELDIKGTERALALEGNSDVDYATDEEKQKLFEALEKQGKRWNPETKQIEDILKVDDLAIFWDDYKKESCISSYTELNNTELYPKGYYFASIIKNEDGCHLCFKNAIKCTSLEQYINFKK